MAIGIAFLQNRRYTVRLHADLDWNPAWSEEMVYQVKKHAESIVLGDCVASGLPQARDMVVEQDVITAFADAQSYKTENAEYSKFTIWHHDGPRDGKPINGSTGVEGWGWTLKLEHEFTGDGNLVGIARYGKSHDDSAVFKQQAGLHFLLYDPPGPVGLHNDVVGIAGNWVQATAEGARDEYDVEAFYRFALFGGLDTTVAYQYAINPALTHEIDHPHVLSLRFRAVF